MRLRLWVFALAVVSSMAFANGKSAMTLEQEARWLIGREYTVSFQGDQIIPGESNCTYQYGRRLHLDGIEQKGWSIAQVRCQGRTVIMLERLLGRADAPDLTWRIIDTQVLPRYAMYWNPRRPNALHMFQNSECTLNGKSDTDFIVMVRMGKHDKIDGRTGVERAWTFDTEQGRIVPLSTRHIVCYRPEPD